MKHAGLIIGLIAGALTAVLLAARTGLPELADAVARLSPAGFGSVCLLQAVVIALGALAWQSVCGEARCAAYTAYLAARLVRDGVSSTLALVPGLGIVAGARSLRLLGEKAELSVASSAIDLFTMIVSQAVLTLIGLLLLLAGLGLGADPRWLLGAAVALAPVLALTLLFRHPRAQRLGRKAIQRSARALGHAASARAVSDLIARLYGDRGRMTTATLLHLIELLVGTLQIWVMARALGYDLSIGEAVMVQALVHIANSTLFMVPWSIGVQEGSLVLVGRLVGIDEAGALALSLGLRVRDILFGLPGVLLWSAIEARVPWSAALRDPQR